MKQIAENTRQTPQSILDDLRALLIEAEKLTEDAQPGPAAGTIDSLRGKIDSAQERLEEIYTGARKRVVAGAKYTDETIRANPYQSIAIAAGVGLLVGVYLGRRNQ